MEIQTRMNEANDGLEMIKKQPFGKKKSNSKKSH